MKLIHHCLQVCFLLVSFQAFSAGHTVNITVDQNVSCFGAGDGQATAAVTGGTGPFTYLWDNSATGAVLTGVSGGTYMVTVTDQSDMSTATATCTITEPAGIVPDFATTLSICQGDTPPNFGGTSPNLITGVWSPSTVDNTTTGTYTFTPDPGQCATTATTTVNVNPIPATPVASNNSPICSGNTLNLVSSTVAGASYSWSGPNGFTSGSQNPNLPLVSGANSGIYSVVATVSGCTSTAGTTNVVIISTPATPVASSNSPVCVGGTLNLISSAVTGATYSWSAPSGSIFVTQNPTIHPVTLLDAGIYTVAVTVNGCISGTASTNVVINSIPAAPVASSNSPVCEGSALNLFASTVPGATYSWSGPASAVFSSQNPTIPSVSLANAGTYNVTATVGGCTSAVGSANVVVNPAVTPTFDPLLPICEGDPVPSLPAASTDSPSITGTWVPATIDNMVPGTYTFTPTGGSCVTTASLTQVVDPHAIPTFNPIIPFCEGMTPVPTLQTASNNAITGSWVPATIDNMATATYTFTPTPGNCATTASLTVVVNPPVIPTFNPLLSICAGSTAPTLPASSINSPAITGTWAPSAVDNMATGTYTFTPAAGECATSATITQIVNPGAVISSVTETCNGGNTAYVVDVTLTGSAGPFTETINAPAGLSGTYTGNVWTSAPITSGTAYSIDFTDNMGCPAANTSGIKNCNCSTAAGTMNTTQLDVCETVSATATHNSDQNLDGTDVIQYILHSSANGTPGTIYGTSPTPVFSYSAPLTIGTTYYISAIAGNDNGSGAVDLTDPCLSIAPGTPVVWHAAPVATPTNSSPVCAGNVLYFYGNTIPGATYVWTGPAGFSSALQNPVIFNATTSLAGTFSLVITANGCASATASTTVTVNSPIIPTFTPLAAVCQGDAAPLVPFQSDDTPPIPGTWSPATFSTATPGTETLTFTPNGGICATTATLSLTVNPGAVVDAGPDLFSCNGAPVVLRGSYTGASGAWATTGPGFTGTGLFATPPSPTTTYTPSGADVTAGSIKLTYYAAGSGSCPGASDSMTIILSSMPVATFTYPAASYCKDGTDPSPVLGLGSVAGFFTSTAGLVINSSTGVIDLSASVPATYTVTNSIAAGGSCPSAAATTSVTISAVLSSININPPAPTICLGSSVSLTASGAGTYVWSPAAGLSTVTGATVSAAPSSSTTYLVTGTLNGCTANKYITVTVDPQVVPTFNAIVPICAGSPAPVLPTTSINSPAITGFWFPSTVDNTASGTYVFTPAAGQCATSASLTVTVNPLPTVSAGPDQTVCQGTSVTLSGSGANTYSWASGVTNGLPFTPASTATYTVFGMDGSGCSGTDQVIVTVTQGVIITSSVTASTNCTSCNGAITSTASNGVAPYNYAWTGPGSFTSTNTSLTNLCPGTYTQTVTDAIGCVSSKTTVVENSTLIVSVAASTDNCGKGQGSATATVTGNTGNVTYYWTPGDFTSQAVYGLHTGTYTLDVTDDNGCTTVRSVTIGNTSAPVLTAVTTDAACGNANGSLSVSAAGGATPYKFSLNNGAFTTTSSWSNIASGTYTITVRDANGCENTLLKDVLNTGLTLSVSTTPVSCNSNTTGSSATVTALNGTAPYSYHWNTGATTASITDVPADLYSCTVTDNNGCSASFDTLIYKESEVRIQYNYTNFDCQANQLMAVVYGGNAPYTYAWSNGKTTPAINNILAGDYTVTVTDVRGCKDVETFKAYTSSYSTISGVLYSDANDNCVKETTEAGLMNWTITARNTTDGQMYYGNTYNATTGAFSVQVPLGVANYELTVYSPIVNYQGNYTVQCPTVASINSATCTDLTGFDIGVKITPIQDLRVVNYCGIARPGFSRSYSITYSNPGTITSDGKVALDIDPLLAFTGSTPSPSSVSGSHIEWDFTNLLPGQNRQINVYANVPTIDNGGTLGRTLNDLVTISSDVTDLHLIDNSFACSGQIRGAYDPNKKEVYSPQAAGDGSIDADGGELYYTVHFQNTGTDTAFTVVVRDTISPLVDLRSLEMLGGSHHYTWSLQPNRCLEVRFNNILLADSNHNEPLSHGFFNYRIHTVDELAIGSHIDNTAGIYFDFNQPVITNTVSTHIQSHVGLVELGNNSFTALVSPNPTSTGTIRVQLSSMSYNAIQFNLVDVNGRNVTSKNQSNAQLFDIDVSSLNNGIYFYTITNDLGERTSGKIVVAK